MPEYTNFARKKLVRDGPIEAIPPAPFVELGMDAIGIADRNSLAGVVRLHSAAKGAGLRPLIGCGLDLMDAPSLLAYPKDREAYGRLSRLLSLGKMRAEKGECELSLADVAEYQQDI